VSGDEHAFEVTRIVDGGKVPLELHGTSTRLFVRQIVLVEDGDCRIESYGYRLQHTDSRASWLMRWEYLQHRGVGCDAQARGLAGAARRIDRGLRAQPWAC